MRAMAFAAAVLLPIFPATAMAQDAAAGMKVFNRCKACHVADADTNKVGPGLKGVIGRTAGTHPGFTYSPAMVEAGKGGWVWDEATLTKYLTDPKAAIPGNKMAFSAMKKPEDIANVIAYLKDAAK